MDGMRNPVFVGFVSHDGRLFALAEDGDVWELLIDGHGNLHCWRLIVCGPTI